MAKGSPSAFREDHLCEEPVHPRTGHLAVSSHLPRGASLSPKGNLGEQRARELRTVFPRPIKRAGQSGRCAKPFRERPFASARQRGSLE